MRFFRRVQPQMRRKGHIEIRLPPVTCQPSRYAITGGHINQDPPYTQKPIYYTFFANYSWSLLLCSPVITNIRSMSSAIILYDNLHKRFEADDYGMGKQKTKTGFRRHGVETSHNALWPRLFCPKSAARTAKKACCSHAALDCRHESSRHTG